MVINARAMPISCWKNKRSVRIFHRLSLSYEVYVKNIIHTYPEWRLPQIVAMGGGLITARKLLDTDGPSDGFTEL